MSEENPYKTAYTRERTIRQKAEQLLEDKSRELYLKNKKLEESNSQLKQQQTVMLQQEKMATLGTLSAGMAHEINNPLAFVKSNFDSLSNYHQTYSEFVALIHSLEDELTPKGKAAIAEFKERTDLEFIEEDLPEAMTDTAEGLDRIGNIIQSLRSFSRTQSSDRIEANVVDGIESTLKLLSNELKHNVEVSLDLLPVPNISCNPSELNQVFLNLIINAKHAVADRSNPHIGIFTRYQHSEIQIEVIDNGCGISEEVQKEIFLPFFTTKPVGEGTGMGLAIAYGIIQDHGGELSVKSALNEGTRFMISLPCDQKNDL